VSIKELIRNHPDGLIASAFRFAEKAHSGQKRKSGEPYFNHVLAAAEILSSWRLDETIIAAGLLHDVVEDTAATLEDIKGEFGDEITFLVDGVSKLGRLKHRGEEAKVENLRKLILALSEDLRVIFIKLADRLHNMRTLNALPPQKQKRVAIETDEIYAPIAYRLGMQHLSGELQDLAFPHLCPKEDRWLRQTVSDKYEERLRYLERIKPTLKTALEKHNLNPFSIDFRAKRWSSLYKKLLRYDMDIDKIYDLVAMRIIFLNTEECYAALGIVHHLWPPLPGRIKDFIAMPKPNGYRSLHTTVIGPGEKFIEIQIRTKEMHEEDENGIAAHWLYAQDKTKSNAFRKPAHELKKEVGWVHELRAWQEYHDSKEGYEEFLKSMKIDFFKDRIFAITPKGDVIDLPAGSTPVDFAYQIHSEIGDACVGAKVNDNIVPLNYELRSGDLVQILTQKNKKPSEDWLKFAKTSIARDRIKAALREKRGAIGQKKTPSKAELKIVSEDRIGLIKDISSVIARSHINILNIRATTNPGSRYAIDKIQCATADKNKIEKIILKLKKVKGVKEISYRLI
jgi:GTP pyrophosphokinase